MNHSTATPAGHRWPSWCVLLALAAGVAAATPGMPLAVTVPVSATVPDELVPKPPAGQTPGKALALSLPIGPLAPVSALAFTADGTRLFAGSRGRVVVWDLTTGGAASVIASLPGMVHDLALSPDGRLLAVAGGQPGASGNVWLYNPDTLQRVAELGEHSDVVYSAAFAPGGQRLATASFDKTVRVWNLPSPTAALVIRDHSDAVHALAFTSDGKYLVSAGADRSVKVFDADSGKSRRTLQGHNDPVFALAAKPGALQAVSAGNEPALRWWNLETGEQIRSVGGHGAPVYQVAFSRDGNLVASAAADKTVRLWDGNSGAAIRALSGGTEWMYSVAFSPDAKLVAGGGWDGFLRIWNVADGRLLCSLASPPIARLDFLAVTPEGYFAVSPGLAGQVEWRVGGLPAASPAFTQALQKPDQVARALSGMGVEPVKITPATGG